jgi:hypothetical protein
MRGRVLQGWGAGNTGRGVAHRDRTRRGTGGFSGAARRRHRADGELRIEQHVVVPEYFQPGRYVILVGNERDFGGWYESGIIRVAAG